MYEASTVVLERTRPRRRLLLLGAPLVLGACACFALEPSPLSLLAPFLGPWAGYLYGHESCTLANVAPRLALAVAGALLAGPLLAAFLRGAWRARALGFTAFALVVWCALASLSVLNMA
jgi:hypothetical protein